MKKMSSILAIVGQVVKYAGFFMVVYDTIVFFKERLEKETEKESLTTKS